MGTRSDHALLEAVRAYKRGALERLGPEGVEKAVGLFRALDRELGARGLVAASRDEIRRAGLRVLGGRDRDLGRFLTAELARLFDAALDAGLVGYHPLRGAARIVPEPARTGVDRRIAAAKAAEVAAGFITDGLVPALLLSPIAVPIAEASTGEDPVARGLAGLSGRWRRLALRFTWLLSMLRVALPVVAVVAAASAALDPDAPWSLTLGGAWDTGQAVRDVELAVELAEGRDVELARAGSLVELGDQLDVPLDAAERVFVLERALDRPPVLFLRHRASGTLVVVMPGRRASLRGGRFRMLR